MKIKSIVMALSCLLIAALVGCSAQSGSKGQDASKIKVEFMSEPGDVQVSQSITLTAQITGLPKPDGANVVFEIHNEQNTGLPELYQGVSKGEGKYSAVKTFEKAGTFDVYIHIYEDELHEMKKKQIVVK